MAFILADRVQETSTTTGTGSIALGGAMTGYRAFSSVLATGDTTYYTVADQSGANWEVGIGAFTSPSTLARTTILSSSNAGSVVTFISGTKNVFISLPASKLPAIVQNARTSAYTLTANDAGEHVAITTGGVTVPAAAFAVGDVVSIYNNSAAAQTITQGASVTMYLAGTATTGNRTLAQRGVCTVLCVAANTFVIAGAGLT
jgi:hypothetical protein